MKFTAELTFLPNSRHDEIGRAGLRAFAEAAEVAGFDAVAINEHPAPSRKWLDRGGHDAFDPMAALSFCAAVTTRVRLLPYLTVVPLHNPFVFAKSVATLDVISDGRLIVGAAAGYLRSEFAAAGVPFDERNARFDESLTILRELWADADGAYEYKGLSFEALGVASTPPPRQPRPPIWIGGNSTIALDRVVRFGHGWAPILCGDTAARTTRTRALPNVDAVGAAIRDLHARMEKAGRDPATVEVQLQSPESEVVGTGDFDTNAHSAYLDAIAEIGVTQFVFHMKAGRGLDVAGVLRRYGTDVIARFVS